MQQLFTEDDITFKKAFKLAASMETTKQNVATMDACTCERSDSTSAQAIHQLAATAATGQQYNMQTRRQVTAGALHTG